MHSDHASAVGRWRPKSEQVIAGLRSLGCLFANHSGAPFLWKVFSVRAQLRSLYASRQNQASSL